jgi:hypothetical protein
MRFASNIVFTTLTAGIGVAVIFLFMRPVLAQTVLPATTSSATTTEDKAPSTVDDTTATSSAASQSKSAPVDNTPSDLVEVDLHCTKAYVGELYDTPTGHLNSGYFVGDASASTTGMIAAQDVGQQAWVVCVDARGHEHEFKLSQQEYASLATANMPQEFIMEPVDQAALDSFSGN